MLEEKLLFKFSIFSSFSLTSNTSATTEPTFTKIQVAVKTLNDSKAFIQVVTKDTNLLIATIKNISAVDWTTYTLFIKNGITAQDVKVVLGTEGNGNNNYSFFDFAKYSTKTGLAIADVLANSKELIIIKTKNGNYILQMLHAVTISINYFEIHQ